MKILHIITSLNDGGAEGALFRLCMHDDSNSHYVVSMLDEGKYGARLRAANIQVDCLNMRQGRISISGLIHLWRLLRWYKPDLVQTWMYHADLIGGLLARLAGIDAVCWGVRNGAFGSERLKRSTVLVGHMCAKLSRYVPRKIVSCSRDAELAHKRLGYAANKFVIVANGYELQRYRPDDETRKSLRMTLGVGINSPLVGMVARYDPQKDHDNLLKALTRLAESECAFECLLVGTGMDNTNVRLKDAIDAAKLDKRIRLLGRRDDIPAIMNALDIHILSSSNEAFPNVLAEAMACGTPCVTTDVGDAALIVGDTGWVAPPRNPEELAKRIAEALEAMRDGDSWASRRWRARDRIAENFEVRKMVRGFQDVWENVSKARFDRESKS